MIIFRLLQGSAENLYELAELIGRRRQQNLCRA
jgi:hypothetical protein